MASELEKLQLEEAEAMEALAAEGAELLKQSEALEQRRLSIQAKFESERQSLRSSTSAEAEERAHDGGVARARRPVERGRAVRSARVQLAAGVEQRLHHLQRAARRRQVEGRAARRRQRRRAQLGGGAVAQRRLELGDVGAVGGGLQHAHLRVALPRLLGVLHQLARRRVADLAPARVGLGAGAQPWVQRQRTALVQQGVAVHTVFICGQRSGWWGRDMYPEALELMANDTGGMKYLAVVTAGGTRHVQLHALDDFRQSTGMLMGTRAVPEQVEQLRQWQDWRQHAQKHRLPLNY